MQELFVSNNFLCKFPPSTSINSLKSLIKAKTQLNDDEYYMLVNGRKATKENVILEDNVHVILKLNGGKGGFGSMLRAIGAQIEKTTNREACRDLSGRRLRDINEEKRLKNWISAQAKREQEAEDRKQKKLERLCELPRHEFNDDVYDKERSDLPERIEDAVAQGMKASCSDKNKRKSEGDAEDKIKKKKRKLWIDDELEDLSDEISDDDDDKDDEAKELNIKLVDKTEGELLQKDQWAPVASTSTTTVSSNVKKF